MPDLLPVFPSDVLGCVGRGAAPRVPHAGRRLGRDVRVMKVTYDAEVGGDTWYVYFEPERYRMVGYRFYHDEARGDGEYIVLEGEHAIGGMRIPARRSWYVNADGRYLGTDELIGDRSVR